MTPEMIAFIVFALVLVIVAGLVLRRKLPKRLNQKVYVQKWRTLQSQCKDKALWRCAVIDADALLDRALKQRKFKGSRPGERMVSAQRKFTSNDGVWFAHNLFKKLINNESVQPKEEDTMKALKNFRQALRDLGALPSEHKNDTK